MAVWITVRGIHRDPALLFERPIPSVNVSEDVQFRVDMDQAIPQFLTALGLYPRHVHDTVRWRVGNEYVHIEGNEVPLLPQACSAPGEREGALAERRLPRASPDFHGPDLAARVLEVDHSRRHHEMDDVKGTLESVIVIARHENLGGMRLTAEPLQEDLDLIQAPTLRRITCMDEHIPFGDEDALMKAVRVREADETHPFTLRAGARVQGGS